MPRMRSAFRDLLKKRSVLRVWITPSCTRVFEAKDPGKGCDLYVAQREMVGQTDVNVTSGRRSK